MELVDLTDLFFIDFATVCWKLETWFDGLWESLGGYSSIHIL
jgi:hypothetical protein